MQITRINSQSEIISVIICVNKNTQSISRPQWPHVTRFYDTIAVIPHIARYMPKMGKIEKNVENCPRLEMGKNGPENSPPPRKWKLGPISMFFREAPDTFNFLRHVMRAIWSARAKCSHRCVSLKETLLKPVQILKHTTKNSAEQTAMRTKWFKHIAI